MVTQESKAPSPLDVQVGGGHYKDLKIQPVELFMANKVEFIPASVIKYLTRYKFKNGKEDLLKARHLLNILIENRVADGPIKHESVKVFWNLIHRFIRVGSMTGYKIDPVTYVEQNNIEGLAANVIVIVSGYENCVGGTRLLKDCVRFIGYIIENEYPNQAPAGEEDRYYPSK